MRALFAVLPLLVGCYATKVVRAPTLAPTEPVPGLMVSTIVETMANDDSNDGVMAVAQTVVDVANNAELDAFGAAVQPAVTGWLATQGVAQADDKERLMVGKKTDWAAVANDFTVLSGTWVDPDGLGVRVGTDTLFAGATFKKMAEKLAGPEPRETYTYTTVTVVPQHEWIFVGVPRVRVSVVVHDAEGNPLLRAHAWGVGQRTAFIVDRSTASLQKGFDEAMAKLAAAEIETLEAR